jgi:hypothetical protein
MKNIIYVILLLSCYTSIALDEPLKRNVRSHYSEKGKNLVSPPIISASNCNSELTKQFDKRFGTGSGIEYFNSVISTSDGGYLMGGESDGSASGDKSQNPKGPYRLADYWIVKTDSLGNKLWDKTIGGNDFDRLNKIIPTNDGGYLLGGSSISGIGSDKTQASRGYYDYWIVKIDANGNKLWDKTFGGDNDDYLMTIIPTNDGNYILGGISRSGISGDKTQYCQGSDDYWIIKINSSGDKIWDKRFGGNKYDLFGDIVSTDDGGYILAGESYSDYTGDKTSFCDGVSDYWLVKIDSLGNKIWDKKFGGNDTDGTNASFIDASRTKIIKTGDGKYLICGTSSSGISGDKTQSSRGDLDLWAIKFDDAGDKIWDKTFGGNYRDAITSIVLTNDGNILLGATSASTFSGDKTQDSRGLYDFWLVKINSNGDKIWDKRFGGSDKEESLKIVVQPNGTYLLGGTSASGISGDKTQASRGGYDYWIVKVKECQNNSIFCANTSVYLSATGCTGTVTWSTGETGNNITANVAQTTTITATCTVSGLTSGNSNAIVITKPITPSISNISPIPPSSAILTCSTPSRTITASGSDSYLWTGAGGFTASTASANITVGGNYTVIGTSTASGCAASASVMITENKVPPTISVTPTSAILTCSNPNITITASGADTYSWTGTGGFTASTASANITVGGTYTVVGTSTASGCTALASVVITENKVTPTISVTPTSAILTCSNPNITITASGADTYSWTGTGGFTASTASTNITVGGTYTVVGTSTASGCTASASVMITENKALPNVSITGSTGVCTGETLNLIATGGGTYTWAGPNEFSATTAAIILPFAVVTYSGTYTVTVTNSNGCINSVTTLVTVNAIPITPTVQANVSIPASTNITLTASGCGGTLLWFKSSDDSSILMPITPTVTTSYYAKCSTIANSLTCISQASGNVIVTINPILIGIISVKTGDWEDPTTWNVNRLPLVSDEVTIDSNHTVTITTNAAIAKKINDRPNSVIKFGNPSAKLTLGID